VNNDFSFDFLNITGQQEDFLTPGIDCIVFVSQTGKITRYVPLKSNLLIDEKVMA
jgi:hypothetical protein